MKLVVGLGNPGKDYAQTRHNIGFMALDRLHTALAATEWQKKFNGLIATAHCGDEKLYLLKPQTFMNLSGQAVGAAAQFYKITLADIIVLHDELELPPARTRIKQGGGAAGHNGLKSIDSTLGQDYWRLRLGIGRPPADRESVHDYVLHNFTAADSNWLDPLLSTLAKEVSLLISGQHSQLMNKLSLAVQAVLPVADVKTGTENK